MREQKSLMNKKSPDFMLIITQMFSRIIQHSGCALLMKPLAIQKKSMTNFKEWIELTVVNFRKSLITFSNFKIKSIKSLTGELIRSDAIIRGIWHHYMDSVDIKVLKIGLIFLLLNDKRKKRISSLHFLTKTYPVVLQNW